MKRPWRQQTIIQFSLVLFFLQFADTLYAQDMSLFLKSEFTSKEGKTMPYRILFPENYNKQGKYPVVLFLHGAGERGNDNEKHLTHGATLFLSESARNNFPAIVLFSQCPAEDFWSSVKIMRENTPAVMDFNYESKPTEALQMAMELTQMIVDKEAVDPSRIYITGLSMGGMGTFEAVYRYPDMFASAIPICGGGDTKHYDKRVLNTAFWIFHGDADAVVDVNLSRQMDQRLRDLKARVKYTEYPGVNHNSWDNAFAEQDFLSWLFSFKKQSMN